MPYRTYILDSVCAAGFSFQVFDRKGGTESKGVGGNFNNSKEQAGAELCQAQSSAMLR